MEQATSEGSKWFHIDLDRPSWFQFYSWPCFLVWSPPWTQHCIYSVRINLKSFRTFKGLLCHEQLGENFFGRTVKTTGSSNPNKNSGNYDRDAKLIPQSLFWKSEGWKKWSAVVCSYALWRCLWDPPGRSCRQSQRGSSWATMWWNLFWNSETFFRCM